MASETPQEPGPEERARSVFVEHLLGRGREVAPDIAALVRAHPGLARELRAQAEAWRHFREVEARLGAGGASLGERLRAELGEEVDPGVSLQGSRPESAADSGPSSELLRRLKAHAPGSSRYRILTEVGRGGMGAVLRIWDEDLRRFSAMKVVLGKASESSGATPAVDARTLGRFLEEAQVTGQLDHPGIVPVHELGLGGDGQVYFTMRLVKGDDLRVIYERVQTGVDGWNPTRALGVLLKVCEAMAYAHDKGVLHRDLKPANVMVGKYGEAYVMDWGLARVLGRADRHDLRLKPFAASSQSAVRTERTAERHETPDSPLVTMDGAVIGTPAYMPPEQARGELEALGPHSDVYSLGAMLYELLAGQMPFVPRGARVSPYTVLNRVLEGPPRPLAELAPRAPAELVAITEKAMAREPAQRYRDMTALAADLRAYLEHRVVRAHATGTWAETRKWVQRNKPLAAALAGLLLVLAAGLITTTLYARRAEAANLTLAERNRELLASERESRIRGLIQELEYFNTLDDDVYTYAKKQTRPAHEWWIEGAELLVEGWSDDSDPDADWYPGLADVRGELAKLRSRARQEGKAELDPKPSAPESFQFDASEDEWWHEQLVQLEAGLLDLQKRLEFARTSVHSPENARLWSEAIAAILSSPRYSGLRLTPQLGLVPIGPDPTTGLWEFAHLASGEPAQRGSDGNLVLLPETGLVLVLLPGGRVPVADSSDQEQDAYLTQIDLDPFFLSKYEMSAGQWERIGGLRRGDAQADGALLPSVNVSWDDCRLALSRVGWLRLSSEAQWEYGCRAGTTPPWWTVAEPEALRAAANLDNAHVLRDGLPHGIGLFRANPFGLHDVLGNVLEWCGDSVDEGVPRRGDGLRDESGAEVSVLRGASSYEVETARVSLTGTAMFRSAPSSIFGLRPARAISP